MRTKYSIFEDVIELIDKITKFYTHQIQQSNSIFKSWEKLQDEEKKEEPKEENSKETFPEDVTMDQA